MKAVRACWCAAVVALLLSGVADAGGIGPRLTKRLEEARPNQWIPVIVHLKEQAINDLEPPNDRLPRAERRRQVLEHLRNGNRASAAEFMSRTEALVRGKRARTEALVRGKRALKRRARAVKYDQFWITNAVALEATPDLIEEIASDPAVEGLELDFVIHVEYMEDQDADPEIPPAVNGIRRIRAPEAWDLGFTGVGAVVGSIDTGVRGTHLDLRDNFRGGSGSWTNAIGLEDSPVDYNGHGTHTTGTAVGRNGAGDKYIGAAPNARWIACRAFDENGNSTLGITLTCMQWMADPDWNPATDDAPDVVNNSWSYSGDCLDYDADLYRDVLQAWWALDIFPVFAAGNHGEPELPAALPEAFAVGAVNRSNGVTPWSGRGPSPCDGTTYPELVAPGTKVKSAWKNADDNRKVLKGTSMAAPHVTGTVALLRGRNRSLSVSQIWGILLDTALDLGPAGPDNSYGWGMVDAYRAVLRAAPPHGGC
jgi:serine protease AprX